MTEFSHLSLVPLHRAGVAFTGGGGITERDSLDFVVDGQALSEKVRGDYASCLGWGKRDWEATIIDRLLREAAPDSPPNRVALYICPECGDFGCGAVTAVIERDGDSILWHSFGYENDLVESPLLEDYTHLGPYRFEAGEYEATLRGSYTRQA
jgi:hypothetical protein